MITSVERLEKKLRDLEKRSNYLVIQFGLEFENDAEKAMRSSSDVFQAVTDRTTARYYLEGIKELRAKMLSDEDILSKIKQELEGLALQMSSTHYDSTSPTWNMMDRCKSVSHSRIFKDWFLTDYEV